MRQECNTADVTAHSLHQSHRHRFHPLTVRVCRTEMKTIKQLWHQGGWGGGGWSPLICVRWPPVLSHCSQRTGRWYITWQEALRLIITSGPELQINEGHLKHSFMKVTRLYFCWQSGGCRLWWSCARTSLTMQSEACISSRHSKVCHV